jgi:putative transposase
MQKRVERMENRHSVEQIIRILGEIEHCGLKISDAFRSRGISEQTCYRWRNKYGGMEIIEARGLKELETENGRLKKLVADQASDIQILKEVNAKNGKPHAEEGGHGDGRFHGAVQTPASRP